MSIRDLSKAVFILLLLLGTGLSSSAEAQDSTLIAYYPFNGNAYDTSGFDNHGMVYGAELTSDRFGAMDSAYYFTGDTSYIEIEYDSVFSFQSGFTFSVWAKGTSSTFDLAGLIAVGRGYPFLLGIDDGDRLFLRAAASSTTKTEITVNTTTDPSEWNHYIGIYKPSEYIRVYKNGVLEGENTDNVPDSLEEFDESIIIGRRDDSSNSSKFYHFNGVLDDIRIYNYAISDSSILELYTEGGWPVKEDSIETSKQELVAYYPFSGNANDLSGFGQESEVYGAELTFDRFGNPNSAYRFDGLNDFIEVADSPEFKSNALSIDFWFHKDDDEIEESGGFYVEGLLWKSFDTGFDRQFSFSIGNQNSPFDIYNTIGNGTDSLLVNRVKEVIEPGKWYHIAGIIDSSKSHLYINGELVQTVVNEGDIKHNNAPVTIGKASSSSSTNRFFKGSIDDIHIYNFSLSDSAIKNLYLAGGWPETADTTKAPSDTLLAHYPFNGDSLDHSGYEHHPWIHGATPSEDRFGWADSAFAFDGMDDYMIIPSPDSLHTKKNLSFSFWAKGEANEDSFTGFVSKPNMSPFGIGMDDQNRIIFSITSGDVPLNLVVEENLTDLSKWHHYLAVFRAGEYLRLYVDGEEAGSLYGTIPNYMNTDSADIWIGATLFDSTATDTLYFKGSIDEIRFYNYDLDDQQVLDIYTLESTIPTSTEDLELTPQKYELYQNYPNPFNPSTTIRFDMPAAGDVSLKVYDITGRLISTLIDGRRSAGTHSVILNASGLSSGVYLYQIRTAEYSAVRKFTLIK